MTAPRHAPAPDPGRAGFTLMEVLVALVITALVLAGVYSTFAAVMRTRERVESAAHIDMTARLVLTRLSREIESAFLVKRNPEAPPESRYTVFAGSQTEVDGRPGDRISFPTFAHTKRGVDADESDQAIVAYQAEEGQTEDGGERPVALMRREWRRVPPPGENERAEPRPIALVEDMQGFRLRFRSEDGEWTDRWDSSDVRTLDSLPSAVEITITLRDERGRDHDYVTVASPRIEPYEKEGEPVPGGAQGTADQAAGANAAGTTPQTGTGTGKGTGTSPTSPTGTSGGSRRGTGVGGMGR